MAERGHNVSAPVRIQRKRTKGWTMPENTVYVGRPSRWGNWWVVTQVREQWSRYIEHLPDPDAYMVSRVDKRGFRTGERFAGFTTRTEATEFAVTLFRANLMATRLEPDGIAHHKMWLSELRGKNLACWCPLVDARGRPVPCHADVLLELANGGTT